MKLYIVYFRTMCDSPDVEIKCVTTDETLANESFLEWKRYEDDINAREDLDSSDWCEACMETFDMTEERKPGDTIYVYIETIWYEVVETTIVPFLYEENAEIQLKMRRLALLEEFPDAEPFDEDDDPAEALHWEDPDVAVDIYFSIDPVVLQ